MHVILSVFNNEKGMKTCITLINLGKNELGDDTYNGSMKISLWKIRPQKICLFTKTGKASIEMLFFI